MADGVTAGTLQSFGTYVASNGIDPLTIRHATGFRGFEGM